MSNYHLRTHQTAHNYTDTHTPANSRSSATNPKAYAHLADCMRRGATAGGVQTLAAWQHATAGNKDYFGTTQITTTANCKQQSFWLYNGNAVGVIAV